MNVIFFILFGLVCGQPQDLESEYIPEPIYTPMPIEPVIENDLANILPAIINGNNAPSKLDYMTHLKITTGKQYIELSCGASLIHSEWLITAAHCLSRCSGDYVLDIFSMKYICSNGIQEPIPLNDIQSGMSTVMIGGLNISNPLEFEFHLIKNVVYHPLYWTFTDNTKFSYDVALVRIVTPTSKVPVKYNCNVNLPITSVTAYGWGTCIGPNCDSHLLQTTESIPVQNCITLTGVNMLNTWCAQGSNNNGPTGVCFGDSGGPNIANDLLVGISDWTTGCTSNFNNMVSGILQIAPHCPWINSIVPQTPTPPPTPTPLPTPTPTPTPPPTPTPTPTQTMNKCKTMPRFPPGIVSNCKPNQIVNKCTFSCNTKLIVKQKTNNNIVNTCLVNNSYLKTYPQCGCNGGRYGFIAIGVQQQVGTIKIRNRICKILASCNYISGKIAITNKC